MEVTFKADPPVLTDAMAGRYIVGHHKCEVRQYVENRLQSMYQSEYKHQIMEFLSKWDFKKDNCQYILKNTGEGVLRVRCSFDPTQYYLSLNAVWNDNQTNFMSWPSTMRDFWSKLMSAAHYVAPDGTAFLTAQNMDDFVRECGKSYMPFELLEGVDVYPILKAESVLDILQNKGYYGSQDRVAMCSDDSPAVEVVKGEGRAYTVRALDNTDLSFEQAEYIIGLLKEYEVVE